MNKIIELIKVYRDPKLMAIMVLGFASGIPLALTGSTLTTWLAKSGVSDTTIGLFAAVTTPYALKFLWSPVVDQIPIAKLTSRFGRRRSWLLVAEILLVIGILLMSTVNLEEQIGTLIIFATLVSFFSATQDIVIDAYRVEILPPADQGPGAGAITFGYRVGMIVSGAGALLIADKYGWQISYIVMAPLVLAGFLISLKLGEPAVLEGEQKKYSLKGWFDKAAVKPFKDFMRREQWIMILAFIISFKLGDAFLGQMTSKFYIKLDFSLTEIASIAKTYGFVATIVGTMFGGSLIAKMGLAKSLWITAVFQLVSNLFFILQNHAGNNIYFLSLTITIENFSGGMGTAAFVAYLSSLCNFQYTATQYALLSSLAAFGRTWFATASGKVVSAVGWDLFFIISAFVAIPGIYLLKYITPMVEEQEIDQEKLKKAIAAEAG